MTIEEALSALDAILGHVPLTDVQELVFRHAWEKWTYEQMADQLGYTTDYVRNVGSQLWVALSHVLGVRVSKKNLQTAVHHWARQHQQQFDGPDIQPLRHPRQDLGEAPDIGNFTGRLTELNTLETWITGGTCTETAPQRCRLIAILGMGGMGKTSLAAKLIQRVGHQFDAVVWRSLRNSPPIEELLANLIQFLAQGHEPEFSLPSDRQSQMAHLIELLREQRCLIVLDNAESVLPCHGSGVEHNNGYGEFLNCLCDLAHAGCIILTSREKPDVIVWKEGITLPVRSLQLPGFSALEAQAIFAAKGNFSGTPADWHTLIQHYAGNPLALKMVAAAIQDLFNSNISEFLQVLGTLVFDDMRDLLDRQFDRLSSVEKDVMFWLAINRDVTSFQELRDDILCPILRQALPSVLRSLKHRFLIETTAEGFTQQPVVMEYMTNRFIEHVSEELTNLAIIGNRRDSVEVSAPALVTVATQPDRYALPSTRPPVASLDPIPHPHSLPLYQTHALLKATAKDYIHDSQTRLILTPVLERLLARLRSPWNIEQRCREQLRIWQTSPPAIPGYGVGNLINLLQALQVDLTGIDLSYLTLRQVAFHRGHWQQVNLSHTTILQSVFLESLGTVWSVVFSPNGQWLAASDATGDIHIWQVADQQKVMTCKGHTSWVCAIAFSPDSQLLASGSTGNIVKLWDITTGDCVQTLRGHTEWVLAVAFHPNGHLLASSSSDRTIKLWQLQTGQCTTTLTAHTDWVGTVTFSPDGNLLVSGSDDGTVKLWDGQTATCLYTLEGHTGPVRSVAFSPDGEQIASGSRDLTVKIWAISTRRLIGTLIGHSKPVRSITYLPDQVNDQLSNTLISASEDGTLRLWRIPEMQSLQVLYGHTGHVRSVAAHPTHALVASGSADQTVKLWHIQTGHCLRTWQGYTNFVLSVACVPDLSTQKITPFPLLASGSSDRTVRLWNLQTGQCLHTLTGHTNDVWSVAFSPVPLSIPGQTGAYPVLASSSTDQTIRLWDIQTGHCLHVLRGHTDWVHAIAFTPDGQFLASASSDQTIRIWEIATGQCHHILQGHKSHIWAVAFSPVSHLLASSSDDHTIKLWNINSGQCIRTLSGHTRRVQAITFSPDGRWLASNSSDQTIVIWDVNTGRCLRTIPHQGDRVRAIVFSPLQTPFTQQTGQFLLSSYAKLSIQIWNAHTGESLHTLNGHTKHICSIAFTPNGETLVSGSEDSSIRLWDITFGECLNVLQSPKPYQEINIFNIQGVTDAQRQALKQLGASNQQPSIS